MVDVHHPVDRRGTHIKLCLGICRDDVRRVAAFCDDPVDPHILRKLLAQQADGVEDEDHRIQRIDPAVRA